MTLAGPFHARDGAEGFDFFIGDWTVRHQRLKRRLVGDSDWVVFGGRSTMRKILGGLGNLDENVIDLPGGAYEAITLRLFDPVDALWSIWWVDGRRPGLEPPVRGRFENGVGTFQGDDVHEGRPVLARFIWSDITAVSAHWEQALSTDGGASWETNWLMDFQRA